MKVKEFLPWNTMQTLVIVLVIFCYAYGSTYMQFSDATGIVCQNEYVIFNITIPSLMLCFIQCELIGDCDGLDYNEVTDLCRGCKSLKRFDCDNYQPTTSNYIEGTKMYAKGQGFLVSGLAPIPDTSLTSSSYWVPIHPTLLSRYCGSSAWVADEYDANPWIQARFGHPAVVLGIYLEPRGDYGQYITWYQLTYSADCVVFENYLNGDGQTATFQGNVDEQTPVTTILWKPIEQVVCLRINSVAYNMENGMRFDVIGYYP